MPLSIKMTVFLSTTMKKYIEQNIIYNYLNSFINAFVTCYVSGCQYQFQRMQMKNYTLMYIIAILLIFTITQSHQLTLPVEHNLHKSNQRHALTAHKKQKIYHDMRVFKAVHSSHLSHHQASSSSYGLNEMGYFFTLNITVAGLKYRLNIDTGSSNIFIKGEDSAGNPAVKFTCRQCLDNSPNYMISYLDGTLYTYQQNLQVQFGPHKFNQDILVAYTAPKQFQDGQGLVGLSFPQTTINHNSSFLQTLKRNNIIERYAFGVNLNFQQHGRSKISFGSPDQNLYEGQLRKYSIDFGSAYVIVGAGFSFDGQERQDIAAAIFDTGNTCISIPQKYESDILKAFNKGGNVCGFMLEVNSPQFSLLRCRIRDFNALPVLTVYVQGDAYQVDKQAYMHNIYQSDDGHICDTYIQSVLYQIQLFLGDGFFNRYYTYFDLEYKEIGIAKNKEVLSYENNFADSSELDDDDRAFFDQLK